MLQEAADTRSQVGGIIVGSGGLGSLVKSWGPGNEVTGG